MTQIFEALSPYQQLELAVRTTSPIQIARTFASHAGQFYDRSSFDTLARQVHDLYAESSSERAERFRSQLDRRLCDRSYDPVEWDVTPHDVRHQ